ncbi:hypothetical protein Unana1_02195 [Umbelopsis nana]
MGSAFSKASRAAKKKESATSITSNGTTSSTARKIIMNREYHNVEDSEYFLPRDNEEMDRLHAVGCDCIKETHRQHFALKTLFKGQVLEVGCGAASWMMDLATENRNFQILGLDISDVFPTHICPDNVKFQIANVTNGIPAPNDSFDLVNLRLFVLALTTEQWPALMQEIFRVVRPGGYVQLCECDFYMTESPILKAFTGNMCKVIENRGQDPRIALKLKPILVSAGFEDVVLDKRRVQFNDGNLGKEFLFDFKSGITGGKVVFAPGMGLDDAMYMNKVNQVGEECTRVNGHLDWYQYVARKPC